METVLAAVHQFQPALAGQRSQLQERQADQVGSSRFVFDVIFLRPCERNRTKLISRL